MKLAAVTPLPCHTGGDPRVLFNTRVQGKSVRCARSRGMGASVTLAPRSSDAHWTNVGLRLPVALFMVTRDVHPSARGVCWLSPFSSRVKAGLMGYGSVCLDAGLSPFKWISSTAQKRSASSLRPLPLHTDNCPTIVFIPHSAENAQQILPMRDAFWRTLNFANQILPDGNTHLLITYLYSLASFRPPRLTSTTNWQNNPKLSINNASVQKATKKGRVESDSGRGDTRARCPSPGWRKVWAGPRSYNYHTILKWLSNYSKANSDASRELIAKGMARTKDWTAERIGEWGTFLLRCALDAPRAYDDVIRYFDYEFHKGRKRGLIVLRLMYFSISFSLFGVEDKLVAHTSSSHAS